MRSLRLALGAVGILLVALALSVGNVDEAVAQAIKDVIVTNDSSRPIPTTVQNTPTVNLTSGTEVGIASGRNTVQVGNGPASPVWTRDMGASTRQAPYNFTLFTSIPADQQNGDVVLAIVQNGEQLVIEHVSVIADVPVNEKATAVINGMVGGVVRWQHALVLTFQGDFVIGDFARYQASQPMRVHVRGVPEGDTEVLVRLVRSDTFSGQAGFGATVSGYRMTSP